MTDEERMAEVKIYERQLQEAFIPMLAEGGKGMVVVRVFAAIAHGDGTTSILNTGGHTEPHKKSAAKLMRAIVGPAIKRGRAAMGKV